MDNFNAANAGDVPAGQDQQHHHHYYAQPAPATFTVTAVPQQVYATRPTNGMATAALTLGILAVVLFWVPIVGVILALVGLGLGIPALLKANKTRIGQTVAIWGLSLSGIALVLFFLMLVAVS